MFVRYRVKHWSDKSLEKKVFIRETENYYIYESGTWGGKTIEGRTSKKGWFETEISALHAEVDRTSAEFAKALERLDAANGNRLQAQSKLAEHRRKLEEEGHVED